MVLEKQVIHMQKIETRSTPLTCTKVKLQWVKDLDIKTENLNLLEDN